MSKLSIIKQEVIGLELKRKVEERLLAWKNSGPDRKPLVINGARQVGKTFSIRQFGERYYDNTVYINLETNLTVSSYFQDDISPERIIRYLESYAGEKILPEKTLIILDEIQSSERALTSLKYFCEDAPAYHIIAAGSLLGVAISRQKYSFPVGKIDTITLHPFDFEEFLWACPEQGLAADIREAYEFLMALPKASHQRAIELFRIYLIVGGMPASILEYLHEKKLVTVPEVQEKILNDYVADMSKYATSTESVKIRACYHSIPAQLAKDNKKFMYKVVQKGGTATIFGEAIEWLHFAGVVVKCQKTEQGMDPIAVYADLSSYKLYMADVGLLTMKTGISQHTVLSGESNYFMGALVENYVAQALTAMGYTLHYWTSGNSAELDFLLQKGGEITAIEVKKGTHSKSRSLSEFLKRYQPDRAMKLSLNNFGKGEGFQSVPLYAVFCIGDANKEDKHIG